MSASTRPRVAVLLATRQGAPFLAEQLDSIDHSFGVDWTVWASDDGSTDGTRGILETTRDHWGESKLIVLDGPQRGLAANFFSLVTNDEIQADAYAFADQDDVWEPGKMASAVEWLATVPADVPALYCGRTRLIDESGEEVGVSPLFRKAPSFANALTQNIASGNTMVFNEAARNLLRATAGHGATSAMHDWWTYLIVTGVGGRVLYDTEPRVLYRQHGRNQIGARPGIAGRLKAAGDMIGGQLSTWNGQNVMALTAVRHMLTTENARRLEAFALARQGALVARLRALRRSGACRQTMRGQVLLWLAAVLGRL